MTAIVDWTFLPTVVWFLLRALVRTIVGICAFWRWLPRRPVEPGFPYVYVNQDGSARELSPDEQKWLSIAFEPGDGGRPYIKGTYEGRDSGNRRSGFLLRRLLPARVRIAAVHPGYDAAVAALREGAATTFLCPEPGMSHWAHCKAQERWDLERERRREALARFDGE